ncbi:MAG: S8 family serine peptidase, partial [Ktedonobacteraceae bacterium]|nr:S8 family serine peptidase [Ktedonobacteraceae bacterium]
MHSSSGTSLSCPSKLFALICVALALIVVAGCGGQADTKPTPTPSSSTTLKLNIPSEALNAPVTGPVPNNQKLHVGVTFQVDQAALDKMGQDGQTQNGNVSTPDAVKKLGISDEDFQKFKQFFGIDNATVKLSGTHTYMTVDIAAGSLAGLLQTHFVMHKLGNRTFYTPDPKQMPKVPSYVADRVLAVTGLDNYSLPPQPHASFSSQQLKQARADDCQPTVPAVKLSQLAHAYGYDGFWNVGSHGEGMTVNLVEIDGVFMPDLQTMAQCYHYNGKISFAGPTLPPGGETTMDMQLLMALAPSVNIADYQAENPSFNAVNDALHQILDDYTAHPRPGDVVSVSLGAAEDGMTPDEKITMTKTLEMLYKVTHLSVFFSSGDCAAFESPGNQYGRLGVSFPASSPYAIAVGGTILNVDAQGNRTGEAVWSDPKANQASCQHSWGGGGGLSNYFEQPSWLTGAGVQNQYSNGKRQVPDVSAMATNVPIYFEGSWDLVGGTSAAAPMWAAGMVLVNQQLMRITHKFVYGPAIPAFLS